MGESNHGKQFCSHVCEILIGINFERTVRLSLWALRFLRLDMTLNRSCFDLKRTMTGLGSPSLAFLRCFKRWLTSISVVWSGGSIFRTLLARSTIIPVVSSASPSSSLGSGRPEIRRLLRRPYCSSVTLSSCNFWTSTWREAILASRSISLALNDLTSFRRDPILLSRSWFPDRMICPSFTATCSSSGSSWKRGLKSVSSSSAVSWLVQPCLPCSRFLVAMVPEEWGHWGVTGAVL